MRSIVLAKHQQGNPNHKLGGGGVCAYPVRARIEEGEDLGSIDQIAQEVAVAMVYNGISHAVMMATPLDLEDFACGFSLTEGIIEDPSQLRSIEVDQSELGYEINMEIASSAFMQLKQRRRQLSGRTGCGICGLESLEAVMPDIQKVPPVKIPEFFAIERASEEMSQAQKLQSLSGALHAAAFARLDGEVLLVREDVGRHNALDKLLGALANMGITTLAKEKHIEPGFILVSSRASYEMVSKVASQSISTLASISAPTSLAIDLAQKANMNLIGFVRPGRQQIYASQGAL